MKNYMVNKMKKRLLLAAFALLTMTAQAENFESSADAVKNMGIGWNLGNTLDSHSGDVDNMWIERWTQCAPSDYETAWGQPVTQRALIKMFAEAGFKAIRVPVTWYPHMGIDVTFGVNSAGEQKGFWDIDSWTGTEVDATWMARVKEIVDMVIGEGMYCILNVHHDTGEATTAWLRADEDVYAKQKERFEALWTQIATEFKDYGEKLVFEGYNEMLDTYGSWCFASFATTSQYDSKVASSAYSAINKYAQSFVNAVRATGGNNAERNLIVNTYGCCSGDGSWNSHLTDPLTKMELPDDPAGSGHIAFEIHAYPSVTTESAAKKKADELISLANKYLVAKGAPVIFGEWGFAENNGEVPENVRLSFAKYFVEQLKANDMANFYWMGLSDGDDRSVPQWTQADLKDAIVKGYYGEDGYDGIADVKADVEKDGQWYNLQGMKISQPNRSGIYIQNGKKIVVK